MNKQDTEKHGGNLSFGKPLPLPALRGQRGSSSQEEASWAKVWLMQKGGGHLPSLGEKVLGPVSSHL